jgi:predicted KAP-like P-loop ATPase
MWPDVDTEIDYLNFSEVAQLATDLIRQPTLLPMSMGVFGGWGAGKSSMLRIMEHHLTNGPGNGSDNPFIVAKFDAWLFQGYDDARASLLEAISRSLLAAANKDKTLTAKALDLLKRVDYLRAIGAAVELGASLTLGLPPMGLWGRALSALGRACVGESEGTDLESIREAGKHIAESFGESTAPEKQPSPPAQILAFRDQFSEVVKELKKTLVVFIDNLDRCLPQVTIETLEAIRLFLFLPGTAFVIAADEEMIRHAVTKHYLELGKRHVNDYLDKLIQVPIRVPLLGVQEVRAYMSLLFVSQSGADSEKIESVRKMVCENLQNSWRGSHVERQAILDKMGLDSSELVDKLNIAERLAPILANAPNVVGNPRIVKRLLNTSYIRCALAKKHGMPVDESLIAKLCVFERCVGEDAYRHLIMEINEAKDGKPKIIAALEDNPLAEDESGTPLWPDAWTAHKDFICQWLALDPSLRDRDLRPAVYLSRESVPLAPPSGQLSARVASIIEALKKVKSINSPTAIQLANSLTPAEKDSAFSVILDELRKVDDWSSAPKGFIGGIILADAATDISGQLAAFIGQLPANSVGPWMKPLIRSKPWGEKLLAKWGDDERGPIRPISARKKG